MVLGGSTRIRSSPVNAGDRPDQRIDQVGLAAYWVSLNFQTAGLITIVVPELVARVTVAGRTAQLARLAALAALVAMIVPPVTGWLSDRMRARGGTRMPMVAAGTALNIAGLMLVADASGLGPLVVTVVVALVGQGVATAAYQAMLPEVVPKSRWGLASGYRALASLVGTIGGLAAGGLLAPDAAVWAMAGTAGAGAAYTAIRVHEPPLSQAASPTRVRIRDWNRFGWVFVSRLFVGFGQTLLMTFVLYFFLNVLHVHAAGRGTAAVGVLALVGAGIAAFFTGRASDRSDRATIVAWAGVPMTAAALGFAALPRMSAIPVLAVLWGLGYGGFLSVDWALALDSIPDLANVARDLGIWGTASNLPSVLAPLAGGALLLAYSSQALGYRALFTAAGVSFGLGSLAVLPVRLRRAQSDRELFSPWLARLATAVLVVYVAFRYRIRISGQLPRDRRGLLLLATHMHDLEAMVIPVWMFRQGSRRIPVVSAGSRRMFEPGFLGSHGPRWIGRWLTPIAIGWVLRRLGVRPIEDRPLSRPPASWAHEIYLRHGNLPLGQVFGRRVAELGLGSPAAGLASLWAVGRRPEAGLPVSHRVLEQPYRDEVRQWTRPQAEADLAALGRALDRGASVYLTPEGRMSPDGRLGTFRAALDVLMPHARALYLMPTTYDPWTRRRLTMVSRVVPASQAETLAHQMLAERPVTLAHLMAEHIMLHPEGGSLAALGAVDAAVGALRALGAHLTPDVDSEAARRRALTGLVRQGAIVADGDRWSWGRGHHPAFPHVPDLTAALARQLAETRGALVRRAAEGGMSVKAAAQPAPLDRPTSPA